MLAMEKIENDTITSWIGLTVSGALSDAHLNEPNHQHNQETSAPENTCVFRNPNDSPSRPASWIMSVMLVREPNRRHHQETSVPEKLMSFVTDVVFYRKDKEMTTPRSFIKKCERSEN